MSDILEKVLETSTIGAGGGGLLNADQADTFIDYMWDETVLGPQVRKIRMKADTQDIDFVGVGKRLVRKATEATDTGENAEATFTKISITTQKLRMDWELSTESLEDNLEGEQLEDHIARLMAAQAANDIEDVAINGDTTSLDPLLLSFDGWAKRAAADGHVIDWLGNGIDRSLFNQAIKAMPRKYMAMRPQLKFFTGSNLIQDYIFQLQQVESNFISPESSAAAGRNQPVAPEGAAGFVTGNAFGIRVQEVPLMEVRTGYDLDQGGAGTATGDVSDVWLTFPENLLWGVKREIKVYREFKPKKDTIEYTMYTRVGTQIENPDAFVVVRNVFLDGTLVP